MHMHTHMQMHTHMHMLMHMLMLMLMHMLMHMHIHGSRYCTDLERPETFLPTGTAPWHSGLTLTLDDDARETSMAVWDIQARPSFCFGTHLLLHYYSLLAASRRELSCTSLTGHSPLTTHHLLLTTSTF